MMLFRTLVFNSVGVFLVLVINQLSHAEAPVVGRVEVIHETRRAYEDLEKRLLKYTASGTFHDDDHTAKVTVVKSGNAVRCDFETYIADRDKKNRNRLPLKGMAFTELITGRGTLEAITPSMGQLKITPCNGCGFAAPVKTTPDQDMLGFQPGASWSRLLDLENPQGMVDKWEVTPGERKSIIKRSSGNYQLCVEVNHDMGNLVVKAWEENSPIAATCECYYSWRLAGDTYLPSGLERTISFKTEASVNKSKRTVQLDSLTLDAEALPESFDPSRPDGWILYRSAKEVAIVGGEFNRVRSMFRLISEAELVKPKGNAPVGRTDRRAAETSTAISGAESVFMACQRLGFGDGDFQAVQDSLGTPGKSGYTMEQLEAFCRSRGAHTKVAKADVNDLERLTTPLVAVILLNDSSFAILRTWTQDKLTVLDVDGPTLSKIPIADWSGAVLLLSDRPIAF